MTQYYTTAFKTGQYPEIQKDKIYMWSRPHSVNAQSPDPVPQPTNYQLVRNLYRPVRLAHVNHLYSSRMSFGPS